ncbi:MAG TPA: hypothetical protein VIG97_11340 [Luteimonas sp.]
MDAAQQTPEQQLGAARQAWRNKISAESQLARLRRYARLTPGMKHDQMQHSRVLSEAEATLRRVLGGAS